MILPLTIAATAGYFLGAVPFGYIVARAHGVNIFEVGSKNPGATNVKRVLGSKAGNTVFALDAVKGALAVGWILILQHFAPAECACHENGLAMQMTGLVAAVMGHSFSCFTRFKGGKGVATAAGGFVVLAPIVTLIGGAVWVISFYASRYVSLASMLAAASLPITAFVLKAPHPVTILAVAVAAFVIIRHRANIKRLLNGTENKFVRKSSDDAAPKA